MFVIPDECKPYMAKQVTQYPDDPLFPWKLAIREAALYCEWLPENPRHTLDLGCGLGRTTVMLHHLYGRTMSRYYGYYLVDATKMSGDLVGGWEPPGDEWCNDLEATGLFLRVNGVTQFNYRLIDVLDAVPPAWPNNFVDSLPWKQDLIISTLAVGFHWPIEDWLPRLLPLCRVGTVLIFGVRHGKYDTDTKFDGFDVLGFAESGWKQDFLALRCISSFTQNPTS